MGAPELALLFVAATVAAAINAVAGGGSLISFPALLVVGHSPMAANVTNTVALWPGYAAGSWAYRRELARQRAAVARFWPAALSGALVGSVVLLATPESTFEDVVPFLVYFASATLLLQRRLVPFADRHRLRGAGARASVALHGSVFSLAVYGAYFGAGLGILLLALLLVMLPAEVQEANALKGLLSALVNSIAVVWFGLFGPVVWPAAATMAVGSLLGGYAGVGVARRLGAERLRWSVVAYGLVVGTVLLLRATQA